MIAAVIVALLCGCQRDLIGSMTEADCNEALAVLLAADVPAEKVSTDNEKTWTLRVPDDRIVQSLDLLRARGLPRDRFANLGEMFKKDGLISTPAEERVRFIHGVSQELSDTLSRMDGVVVARVHIVLPNNDPLAVDSKPSSASVFIKHRPEMSVADLLVPIKNLVAHSVEGLTYEQVSVTFVAADAMAPRPVTAGKTTWVWTALLIAGIACAALFAFLAWIWKSPADMPGDKPAAHKDVAARVRQWALRVMPWLGGRGTKAKVESARAPDSGVPVRREPS
jgi:type III secretion protein J